MEFFAFEIFVFGGVSCSLAEGQCMCCADHKAAVVLSIYSLLRSPPLVAHVHVFFAIASEFAPGSRGAWEISSQGGQCAMGNSQGVFISPSFEFPSLGPHRNLYYKNSDELKNILHAEPEPPREDWMSEAGLG